MKPAILLPLFVLLQLACNHATPGRSVGPGNASSDAIRQVLAEADQISREGGATPLAGKAGQDAMQNMLDRMHAIDLAGTPADFQDAFNDYRRALVAINTRGSVNPLRQMMQAARELDRAALKYGVQHTTLSEAGLAP